MSDSDRPTKNKPVKRRPARRRSDAQQEGSMADAMQDTRSDLEQIKEDIAALKRDLATAVENMRGNASSSVTGLAQEISDQASALYREVSDRGTKATQALGHKVEEQPLTSVMLAFAVGYVVSRITR